MYWYTSSNLGLNMVKWELGTQWLLNHLECIKKRGYGYGSIPINKLIAFLGEWTSINPSYFGVNRRGTGFWPIPIFITCYYHCSFISRHTLGIEKCMKHMFHPCVFVYQTVCKLMIDWYIKFHYLKVLEPNKDVLHVTINKNNKTCVLL